MPAVRARYAERRGVPWWWWLVALLVAVPSVEVVAVFAPGGGQHRGWLTAAAAFAATVAAVAVVLLALSRSRLRVDSQGLWVDGDLLPAAAIGRVRRLDAEEARLVLGRDAHVGARLSIKPWLTRAIQIEVVDPDDATPYWVVASRAPAALATALQELGATATGDETDHPDCPAGRPGVPYRAGVEKGRT